MAGVAVKTLLMLFTASTIICWSDAVRQLPVVPGSLAKPVPPGMSDVIGRMSMKSANMDDLRTFLRQPAWVRRFIDCMIDIGYCNMEYGAEVFAQLEDINAGRSGLCDGCTRREKIEQLNSLLALIRGLREGYPKLWNKVATKFNFVV